MYSTFTGPAFYTDEENFQKLSFSEIRDKDAKYVEDTNNGWLAMVQHHFVSAWVPPQGEVRHNYTRALGHDLFAVGTLISLKEIAPGATQTNHAVLYSGPQEQARLEQLAPGLELVVDYGWLTFLAKPIYWLLDFLYGIVGNWGWAIVLLTCIVKAVLYPISAAGYRSMARMKEVTPRMKQLQDRYKDDKQRLNQAMMELGALVCGKKPRCGQCPLARFCTALHLGIVHERPVPGKKAEITPIEVVTGVLSSHDRVFVQKRLPQGAWGGLWEFPGGRVEPGETPEQAVVREFAEETGFTVRVTAPLGIIRHGYTTYRVRLHCFALELVTDDTPRPPEPPVLTAATACRWLERGELESLAMPAAHRKLADSLTAPKGPLLTAF